MSTLTKSQAAALMESNWWEDVPIREAAAFQLAEKRRCIPFAKFQEIVEAALGRPVWTHEFADPARLIAEMSGEIPTSTFEQILALIPEEKRVVLLATREEKRPTCEVCGVKLKAEESGRCYMHASAREEASRG